MSSAKSLFHRLPPDLLPLILAHLTPHEKLHSLPAVCVSFAALLTPSSFKSDDLLLSLPFLHALAQSPSLRHLLSSVPSLSFTVDSEPEDVVLQPSSLLSLLQPHLLTHITDAYFLATVSQQFLDEPDRAAMFALFALLSYVQPFTRLAALRVHAAGTTLSLHLSPLSFPSLTSVSLSGVVLQSASLSPLLALPALVHLDLCNSHYREGPLQPLSKLLLSSGATMWLQSLTVPQREFWGKLDSVTAVVGTRPARGLRSSRPGAGRLTHFQPAGLISRQDFDTLAAMSELQSLVLDGSWMFAADFLAFASSLHRGTTPSARSAQPAPFRRSRCSGRAATTSSTTAASTCPRARSCRQWSPARCARSCRRWLTCRCCG